MDFSTTFPEEFVCRKYPRDPGRALLFHFCNPCRTTTKIILCRHSHHGWLAWTHGQHRPVWGSANLVDDRIQSDVFVCLCLWCIGCEVDLRSARESGNGDLCS